MDFFAQRSFFRLFVVSAMHSATSVLRPGNPLSKKAKKWKKAQAIISLTLDELLEKTKGKKLFIDQKVDGETAIMEYRNGRARFGSLGGRIHRNLPVLNEIEKILKKEKIRRACIVGELVGYDKGKIIPFSESESLIKNPRADKEKLHWFPYQIISIDGEKFQENDFESYMKIRPRLDKIFAKAKYVHPTEHYTDGKDAIRKAWKKLVEEDKNEGIIVRTSDNIVYKTKPVFTYDLVIIAVGDKKGKNWPKKQISNVLTAFMDKDRVFRVAGEVGTGWSAEERKELFRWAHENKVGEDDTYIWVKPQKVIEVQWERSHLKENQAYKYTKGHYESIGKKPTASIVKPRFIRYRTDKSVNPADLRLTQIPDWKERCSYVLQEC